MFPTEGAAMAWTTLNGNGDNANDNVGGGNGATSLVLGRGLYALANKCRRHLRVVWEIWPCVLHRCDLARSAYSLSLVLGFLRQHGGGSSALGEPGQIWYESIRGAGAIDICQSPPLPPGLCVFRIGANSDAEEAPTSLTRPNKGREARARPAQSLPASQPASAETGDHPKGHVPPCSAGAKRGARQSRSQTAPGKSKTRK